ncbi:redoxin family protein [Acidicapsa dinghuensis]|uniref:Redoxin family protein n=1 Tax=Acidicapsa dinghuensis TaxID=2218256 RepID=A0ABW1ELA9_9BACT|nr:redoxin family protein [Acidicapsa dinghuensis]
MASVQPVAFDLDGKPVNDLAAPGAHVVVLVFAAIDCPISNRYIPTIEHLRTEWKSKGVRVWWVFPNPNDTASTVKKHDEEFSMATPVLLDTHQNLVHLAHAGVTPEAAVFSVHNGQLHEIYHGRIDNRYRAFGVERPQPTTHELADAIEAALTEHAAPKPEANPVGCAIVPLGEK